MSRRCTTGRKHVYFVDGEALTKSVPLRWKSKKHPKATHRLQVICRECGKVKVMEPDNMKRWPGWLTRGGRERRAKV